MAEKTIDIASPILSRNERLADQLRQRFNETGTYVINVLSSPLLTFYLRISLNAKFASIDVD